MIRKLLVATALSLSMTAPALAADDAQQAQQKQGQQQQAASGQSQDGNAMTMQQAQDQGQVMPEEASELIGADVYGPSGDVIGEVTDLVVNQQDKLGMAVLSVGGFLGIGDKDVALPFDQVKMRPATGMEDEPRFMVDMTEEELESMQEYEPNDDLASWIGNEAEDRKQIMERRVTRWEERVERTDLSEEAEQTVNSAWNEVEQSWQNAEQATGNAWQEAEGDLDQSLNELQQAWRQATDQQVAESPDQAGQSGQGNQAQ